ncbi:cytochrome c biogenesis protein CcsA [Candidatus Mycalebacterium sp.]
MSASKKTVFAFALLFMAAAIWMSIFYAPTELKMGHAQRIFYSHMGAVAAMTVAFIIVFVSSIAFLRSRKSGWDVRAVSAAEVGVVFTLVTMLTGAIWAKQSWGTWWVWWDAQLQATFVLFLLYCGYLLLRRALPEGEKSSVLTAVFACLAFIDLPWVYVSARVVKRDISPIVFGPGGEGIAPEMMHTLLVNIVAFVLLFILILHERERIETLRRRIGSRREG